MRWDLCVPLSHVITLELRLLQGTVLSDGHVSSVPHLATFYQSEKSDSPLLGLCGECTDCSPVAWEHRLTAKLVGSLVEVLHASAALDSF